MTVLDTVLEWVSTAILTVLFAWMAIFLLSVTSAFTHSDMKVVRAGNLPETAEGGDEGEDEGEGDGEGLKGEARDERAQEAGDGQEKAAGSRASRDVTGAAAASGGPSPRAGKGEEGEEEDEDDEEWEGLETSELEERFNAAATLIVAMVTPSQGSAGQQAPALGEGMQLLLYSLYKQATEGPCTTKQPAFFNLKARAKWDAWKQLGKMPLEEAMEKYVELVASIAPGFSAISAQEEAGASDAGVGGGGGAAGGRSVSTFQDAEGEKDEDAGEQSSLVKCAASGDPESLVHLLAKLPPEAVNEQDEEGRTALHWAVDRGHVNSTRILLQRGAAVDVQDSEGQTALHYAALCEHQEVAGLLLEQGASKDVRDSEGKTAADLFPSSWS